MYDKLIETMRENKDYSIKDKELIEINKLTAAIVFTCMGNIFIQAGEEFARTKKGEDNSYNLSADLNKLDWSRAYEYHELVEYYKGFIELRKKIKNLYINTADCVKNVRFIETKIENVVAFTIKNKNSNDGLWNELYVVYNSSEKDVKLDIPDGKWQLLINKDSSEIFKTKVEFKDEINILEKSAVILGRKIQ
ncbi:hypothetical protein FBD77_07700 [Clostridium butyricum]|nr:hypothetical protein [Clostridium butyricum]